MRTKRRIRCPKVRKNTPKTAFVHKQIWPSFWQSVHQNWKVMFWMPPLRQLQCPQVLNLYFWCFDVKRLLFWDICPLVNQEGPTGCMAYQEELDSRNRYSDISRHFIKIVVFFFETINKFRKKNRVVWDTKFYIVVNRMPISCHELFSLRRLHCLGTQDFH